MKPLRGKLTYADVISTLCLILLLGGGTAYAASRLEKESVGARQLAREAVTPAKLSKASKKTLEGPVGPQGQEGAVGPAGKEGSRGQEGPPGKEGPQGPGAITIEHTAPSTVTAVDTVGGVTIKDFCTGSSASILLQSSGNTNTLTLFGTYNTNANVVPYREEGILDLQISGQDVETALEARNTAVDAAYTTFDLHLGTNCKLSGVVTPSTVG